MPTIKRQSPLLAEGEYCGIAKKVSLEWVKPRNNGEEIQTFRIPLHTHNGGMITAFARCTENTSWIFETICKSGEIILPDGAEEITLTTDHLERRRFYFGVQHNNYEGRIFANVRFHTATYAIGVNPALASVTFPNEAVRPLILSSPETNTKDKSPADSAVSDAYKEQDISDAEMAQAIEYARRLHAKQD